MAHNSDHILKSGEPSSGSATASESLSPANTQSTASWLKDSLLGLQRRLIGSSSPSREKEGVPTTTTTELQDVGGSEWLVIDSPPTPDMSSSVARASATGRDSPDNATNSFRKRTNAGIGNKSSQLSTSTPPTGHRTNSLSGKNPKPPAVPASSSPSASVTGRKTSARGSRPVNLEVQNGDPSPLKSDPSPLKRSVSPGRVGTQSPVSGSTSSPSTNSLRSSTSRKKGILVNDSAEKSSGNHTVGPTQSSSASESPRPGVHGNSQVAQSDTNSLRSSIRKKVNDKVEKSSGSQVNGPTSESPRPGVHGNSHVAQTDTNSIHSSTKKKGILVNEKSSSGSQVNHAVGPTQSSSESPRPGVHGNSHVVQTDTNSIRSSTKKKGILVNDNAAGSQVNHTVGPTQSSSESPRPGVHGNSHVVQTDTNSIRSSTKKKGILVNDNVGSQVNHTVGPAQASSESPRHGSSHTAQTNGKSPKTNGKVTPIRPTTPQALGRTQATAGKLLDKLPDEDDLSASAFEKVRDTLRISRPKKKKKPKGKLAYSIVVDPGQMSRPEMNLHDPDKYQDPFETSYAENGEAEKKMDHLFKPASIPHNKPEYCDHCGGMAWGLYRQVLKCSRCNFIAHRKCEGKVQIGCSLRLEQAILHHDKQVEDVERIAATEEGERKREEGERKMVAKEEGDRKMVAKEEGDRKMVAKEEGERKRSKEQGKSEPDSGLSVAACLNPPSTTTTTGPAPLPSSPAPSTPSTVTPSSSTNSSAHSTLNPQLLTEKVKLSRKIREYNRKTTPVHHIHIKSTFQASDPTTIEYHGFVRVHMQVQRPIHVSTAITRTSWYRLMRPVKERTLNDVDGYEIQTAFYLPLDTNRLVHIQNVTTTKELVQILLKKFCVTDNPKKFSLYEEYGGDCRRLFEEDRPLDISLDASVSHRNSKLVLRDNTYSTIQWDAFSSPELGNFIQMLQREEELYEAKLKERFEVWKTCIQQSLKEKCMEEQAKKTRKTVSSRLAVTRGKNSPKAVPKSPKSPKNSLKKSVGSKPFV